MAEERQVGELLESPAESDRLIGLAQLMSPEADVGPHLASVMSCLRHESEPVRHLAVAVLGRVRPPAVMGLLEALGKTQTVPVRMAAAAVLAGIGTDASLAVPELCRCLTSEDESLRSVASVALGKVGAGAVDGLRRMLQFSDLAVVTCAVNSLAMVGTGAAAAIPDIRAVGSRSPVLLQLACATALASISGDPGSGLPVLRAALGSTDPAIRKAALGRIAQLGPLAKDAIPDVGRLVRDPEKSVRAEACLSLGRIRTQESQVGHSLAEAMADAEAEVRMSAIIGMSAFGEFAKSWDAHLRARFDDPDANVAAAAKALVGTLHGTDSP